MKTSRSRRGLAVRGPAARGRCGGRTGRRDPVRRRFSAVLPRRRHPGGGAAGLRWAPETRAREPPAVARGRGRCRRPILGLLLLPLRGRAMPRGAEALDLPEWNRASGQSSGTRRRSVPQGRPALSTGHAMSPLHSRVLLQGPIATHSLGCFPPWVFSRLHLFSTSHCPRQDPLRCLPLFPRPRLGEANSRLVEKVSQDPRAGGHRRRW